MIYLPREPHVLPFTQLIPLVRGAPWRRIAVLGDSIAEGVREPSEGFRDLSWIDRIAEPLRAAAPGLTVMNLGRRGLLASEVRERQLDAALGFEPDLAILAAGGNDALQPSFERELLVRDLDAIAAPLRGAGADLLMIELLDFVSSGLAPAEHAEALDARLRGLAEATRQVAAWHGAMVVRMRSHPASADPGVYASDRLHLNARGHAIVATEALRTIGATLSMRAAA